MSCKINPANAKFLLKWINLHASSDHERVDSITDEEIKRLLVRILHLVDDQTADDLHVASNSEVLSIVASYLGESYHLNLSAVINNENLDNNNEMAIGKVITLVLCAAILCENLELFVNQIAEMDVDDQFTFKFLVETVLSELERGCLTAESFSKLLSKKVNLSQCQRLDQSDIALSAPHAVLQSPVEAFFTNSPLKSLVGSPQLKSKQNQLMLNKLQQRVSKLESSLDLQVHVQAELENELREKNKEIDSRDATIIGLRSDITKLSSSVEELELMREYKDMYEKTDKENTRLKQKVVELQTFRQQCGDLEQKVTNFMQEKEQFEKERVEVQRLTSSLERYRSKIHHLEFESSELQATLKRKDQVITKLEKDLEEAITSASKSAEMRREYARSKLIEVDDVLEDDLVSSAEDGPPIHAPIAPCNIDSQIIDLELEKRRLLDELSSAVNQEEFLALKETLEVTKASHSSYKENYVLAKTKIQELEEELVTDKKEREHLVEQLKNVQEQCFQEVEELKSALVNERSLKTELVQELDMREKKLQETNVEIQALSTLKTGLEGSLQTSNARALDDKVKYERELSLKKEEVDKIGALVRELEKALEEKNDRVSALEQERDQVRNAYEQMLADVRSELDAKMNNVEEEQAGVLAQFRLRAKQLEEDHEKMKEELARKQKSMLEEAKKSAAKIQEACEEERASWKKKFDQLSEEVMDTRSEMLENSKKHSEELIEIRRKAREGEEQFDKEARKVKAEKMNVDNQLLRANTTISELELELKRSEATKKELDAQCEELKGKCLSLAAKRESLEADVEQMKKNADLEKERFASERKKLEEANITEIYAVREALEKLKKDYSDLEMKRNHEIEKEKERQDELIVQIEEIKTSNDERSKRVENLEEMLHVAFEEKNKLLTENDSSQIEWEKKQRVLDNKIKELESASEEKDVAFAELRNQMEKIQADKESLEQKAKDESLINRRLGTKVHSLEAQLAHADQQIREQRQKFEKKNKIEAHRRQTVGGVEPKFCQRQGFIEDESSADLEESLPFALEDLSDSLISNEMMKSKSNNPNKSFVSLYSASSSSFRPGVQTRSSRRQSAVYVRGETPPERRTTDGAAYFIVGPEFGPEMEQDADVEYDWNRLAELQRRNASCLPHLQTSYPVETQMGPNIAGQEDALKTGRMSLDSSLPKPYTTRKRKSEENGHKAKGLPKSISAPTITPAKQSRSQRLSQAMQSALSSLRSRSSENLSKDEQEPEAGPLRRESLAYSIEITPPKVAKKAPIERRRTISRYTGTSRLLGCKSKESLKKSKTQNLGESARQERKPLIPRKGKNNAK